ncbi:taste receptor type 2 member 9-like [Spea bombifrons]|uniref:taste receptor type 2 member 9-like n=1 Tax=Spea bombifrons TaxID=233779 RepID=UPI0023490B87|nr:taste receptor type 2 member 9-like [Spea bombifrons]
MSAMATMTPTSLWMTFDIITTIEIMVGLVVNAFIVSVMVIDFYAGRRLKPCDKILVGLGLSRSILDGMILYRTFNRIFSFSVCSKYFWIFQSFQLFCDFSSLWLAMLLSLFYYVKTTIFTNPILLRFKLRMPDIILHAIAASLLISLMSGLLFAWTGRYNSDILFFVQDPQKNRSYEINPTSTVPAFFFGHFVPFIITSITTSLLIGNITVHVKRIRSTITSFSTPRVGAHLSAIRSVCLLHLITVVNLIATIVFRFFHGHPIASYISSCIVNLYPTLHSAVLIFGNTKLRRAMLEILHHAKTLCGEHATKPNLNGRTVS